MLPERRLIDVYAHNSAASSLVFDRGGVAASIRSRATVETGAAV